MKMKSNIIFLWIIFMFCRHSREAECPSNSENGCCCAGFYRNVTTKKCDECPIGYYEVNCSTKCDRLYYGKQCLNMCRCTERQMCSHIHGCVDRTSTGIPVSDVSDTNKLSSTEYRDVSSMVTEYHDVSTMVTESITTTTKIQDTTVAQKSTIMSLWFYIIVAAVCIFIIGCVLAVRSNRSRLTQSKLSNEKTVHFRPRIIPEININEPDEDSTVQDEDLYCEIRESQIVQASHLSPWHVGTNDNTLLRASNVYNHLSFYHSTPNLDSCVAGIYDQSNPYPILQNIKRRNSTDGVYIEPETSNVPCNIKEEIDGYYGQVWKD